MYPLPGAVTPTAIPGPSVAVQVAPNPDPFEVIVHVGAEVYPPPYAVSTMPFSTPPAPAEVTSQPAPVPPPPDSVQVGCVV